MKTRIILSTLAVLLLIPNLFARPQVNPLAGQKHTPKQENGTNWGEPVEGVQARLRATQTQWNQGTTPTLLADVRNQGTRKLMIQKQIYDWQLEVDGKWFQRPSRSRESRALPSPFIPGRQYENIAIKLDRYWEPVGEEAKGPGKIKRLEITPGKHILRVAITATADKTDPGHPIRATSNPVEIEILEAGK